MKTFKEYLIEGGNAIKSASRINQLNVKATLNDVYKTLLPKLGLSKTDVQVLGSAGKKDPNANGSEEGSSGDIDLAISIPALLKNNNLSSTDDVNKFIFGAVKGYSEIKNMQGLGIISVAFPIVNEDGKQEGKFVQLDLMPVQDIHYAKWSYHSPKFNESKYKALYYKEFYYAIAKHMDMKVLKKAMDNSGKEVPAEWERYFFDLNKGLMKGIQSAEGKDGKVIKSVKVISKEIVSTDPIEITQMLFGPDIKPADVDTWEKVWKIVNSPKFIYKEKLPKILAMVKKGINNKGYPIPAELDR